tara:strand:- start:43000 stop:43353 length:354 start_codon:yes stop_codon:yes gene_type:complete
MNSRLIALLSVLVIATISVVATIAPGVFSFLKFIPWGDKLGHFVLFGALTLAIAFAIPGARSFLYGAVLTAVLVVIEETLQILAPTRSFSMLDLGASLSGVLIFTIAGQVYRGKNGK